MITAAMLLALATTPAHALTPPAGWTATGPHRAVRDANNPALGEVREFNVNGGTGDPVELNMMLRAAGTEAQSLNPDGSGAVGMLLKDQRLGRARFKERDGGVTWMVVMAAPNVAGAMDPDAIITAAFTPAPAVAGWGGQTATPLAPGGDGAPWGPAAAATAPAQAAPPPPSWVQPATAQQAGWTANPAVVGRWAGTAFIKFAPTKLVFDFKADGSVTVERLANGRSQILNGTWGTNGGTMRLQVPGGGDAIPFTVSGNTVGFPFEDAKVNLQKQ
jgi:hypothetical protein